MEEENINQANPAAEEIGEIKIAEDVVLVVAGLAVGEVKGVTVVNSLTDGIVEKFTKKNYGKGIRVEMQENWVLKCYPRSGLGFKYRLQLNNTVGIIDSDYFYSDNEGHIFAKLTNDSNEGKTVELEAGSGFMQGIFVEYGITMDDDVTTVRNGGFGSTSQR